MQEPLEHLLDELREALDDAEEGHPDRERLADLAGKVEHRLAGATDEHHGLLEELRENVRQFEVTHPRLAGAMGRAADALASIGL